MIEQKVIVTRATDEYLILSPYDSGCHGCQQEGCGVASLAGLFGPRVRELRVPNTGEYLVNDILTLEMDGSLFLRGVFFQYLLPLIAAFLAILMATAYTAAISLQAISAAIGLVGGVLVSRFIIRGLESRIHARMFVLKRQNLSADTDAAHVLSS